MKQTLAEKTKRPKATPVREWKLPPGVEEPLMAQERVAESKYYTGPSQQMPAVASGELPQGYNEERIAILSRDPFVAYAYWEATPARIEREKAWFGWDSKLCVRIYDITGVQFDGRNAIGYYRPGGRGPGRELVFRFRQAGPFLLRGHRSALLGRTVPDDRAVELHHHAA